MQLSAIIARVMPDSQALLSFVASRHELWLLQDDHPPIRAMREQLRFANRLWFEGVGNLFNALCDRLQRALPHAILRLSDEEMVDGALLERITRATITDILVSSRERAESLREDLPDAPFAPRVHVLFPLHQPDFLAVHAPPWQRLRLVDRLIIERRWGHSNDDWRRFCALGERCLQGAKEAWFAPNLPFELESYLVSALGIKSLEATDGRPLTRIVVWGDLDLSVDQLLGYCKRLAPGGELLWGSSDRKLIDRSVMPPSERSLAMTLRQRAKQAELALDFTTESGLLIARRHPSETVHSFDEEARASQRRDQPTVTSSLEDARDARLEGVAASNEPPLVSAVLFVYNVADTIDRALGSFRRQSYPNLEIVVVNDGSTDETPQLLARHAADDPRIRLFHQPNKGRPAARNACIAAARGEILAWLDGDDEALPHRIWTQVEAFAKHPNAEIVFSDAIYLSSDQTLHSIRRYRSYQQDELPWLCWQGLTHIVPVLASSAAIKRSLFERLGNYDESLLRAQDFELWVRSAAARVGIVHLPIPLTRVQSRPTTWMQRAKGLDYYVAVAKRLLGSFAPQALQDPLEHQIGETPAASIAFTLMQLAVALHAPREHEVYPIIADHLGRAMKSRQPGDVSLALYTAGAIKEHLGDDEGAKQLLRQAAKMAPDIPLFQRASQRKG
jgi:hypothetical protein